MLGSNMYATICPICGKSHVQRKHINVICGCGAKFYYIQTYWLDRMTGVTHQFTKLTDLYGREVMVSKEAAEQLFNEED